MTQIEFGGQVAIVTGAGRGLGLSLEMVEVAKRNAGARQASTPV